MGPLLATACFTAGLEFGFVPDREVCNDRLYYHGLVTLAGYLGILFNFAQWASLRAEFAHSGFNLGFEFRL